jgi:DNA-binding NarL/FixJ family response regulator
MERLMMAKTVLVVDDSVPVRRTIRNLFDATEGFEVCGEAENGVEGVQKAEQLRPDLIILDLSMPVMNGLDAARILHRILPSVPVILFSGHSAVFREEEAKSMGISALVSKDDALGTLLGKARSLVHVN